MAVDHKLRAKIVSEHLNKGATFEELARKYPVSERTIKGWVAALKKPKKGKELHENCTPSERRVNLYHEALEKFAIAALDMLNAQAELLADKEYVRNKETPHIIAHTRFIHERLIRHIEIERGLDEGQSALPESAGDEEAITPELVA